MPCIEFKKPPAPALPKPFGIPPFPLPGPPGVDFCCKLPPLPLGDLPTFIPGKAIPSGVIDAINGGIKALLKYIDLQPLDCPRE